MVATRPGRAATAALAVSALVLAAGCAGTQTTSADAPTPVGSEDPGIGHVHALSVDPGDGALYIAGHYGLFKVTSKTDAVRVAGRIQDNMGFTILGPKTFLASGHPSMPDMQAGKAPHLGLIRSTDAGVTWTTVSDEGTADFHSLQPAGTELYAYDSQTSRVRRSGDEGRTWKLGAQAQIADLAAHAGEPLRVYATTAEGLARSTDGGESFTPLDGAPPIVLADAPAKDTLIGAAEDGRLHTSQDAGRTWTELGRLPAPPSALNATDPKRLLAALQDGTAVESTDGGRTFTVVFQPANASH
ncbi:F510_1955 family glycosylhydrolase [Sinosporangium siamense]|uniref:Exo-alpha-sialidase n=1 Tax=Sinosporangium siamense TaxID=1367973 RepID=A0A919RG55_9ACTN|nr:sialidase family protein [Sinosporangium siamense]GII91194.1 hypothetical protein Ssi02_14250 [Sinosporangium siamense]